MAFQIKSLSTTDALVGLPCISESVTGMPSSWVYNINGQLQGFSRYSEVLGGGRKCGWKVS